MNRFRASSASRSVAAWPKITSLRGVSFSAINRAWMMPVESRTQLTLMSGWALLKRSENTFRLSPSTEL
jgi:hypothetical protein